MKRMKKGLELLLCLILLAQTLAMGIAAAPDNDDRLVISEAFIGGLQTIVAGQYAIPVSPRDLSVPANAGYAVEEEVAYWVDEYGKEIHNDHYTFEAGRTYQVTLHLRTTDGNRRFSPDVAVQLSDADAADYTAKRGAVFDDRLTVTFSFSVAGARSYPAISLVELTVLELPQDGATPLNEVDLAYNNADVSFSAWDGELENNKFVGGKTYTLIVDVRAREGYDFVPANQLMATIDGRQAVTKSVSTQNGNRVVRLTFPFRLPEKSEIPYVRLEGIQPPTAGQIAAPVADLKKYVPYGEPYSVVDAGALWHVAKTGRILPTGERFQYGVEYCLGVTFRAADPNANIFTPDTQGILDGVEAGRYTTLVESVTGGTIRVEFHFIADFPAGCGGSEARPVDCYCLRDLKGALTEPGIRYVRLMDVAQEELPSPPFGDPKEMYYSIMEWGTKTLILAGDATFSLANWSPSAKSVTQAGLIYVTGDLEIKGDGTLRYMAPIADAYNAVIVNRGTLTVSGNATIEGWVEGLGRDGEPCRYPGCAISQHYAGAVMNLDGGRFLTRKYMPQIERQGAVVINAGKANIRGGVYTFTKPNGRPDSPCYGLWIGSEDARVSITGGEFDHMLLPQGKTIGDYAAADCLVTLDGKTVARTACDALKNGKVNVRQSVTRAEIHINSPRAGAAPSFRIHAVDDTVRLVDLQWTDLTAHSPLTAADAFIPGHRYAVSMQIAPAADRIFAVDGSGASALELTVNSKTVSPQTVSGFDASQRLALEYDMGECSAQIDEVALTVTPPRPGRPLSDVTVEGDFCALYPTDPIEWYDSTAQTGVFDLSGTFVAGHEYELFVWVKAKEGCSFSVDDRLDPAVTATVNGAVAPVVRAYEQAADEVICVHAYFGVCEEPVVTDARVYGVFPPVAGETPVTDLTTASPENYRVVSATWTGDDGVLLPPDTFLAGKTYRLEIRLEPVRENGLPVCSFAADMTAYVNGSRVMESAVMPSVAYLYVDYICPLDGLTPGDVDENGAVTAADALMALQAATGKITLTETQTAAGDVDGQSGVTASDALMILQFATGKIAAL
ncbi:MAG: dockerin type I repeat-containing protein [Acutalibacteraceae bacterium]|jgi:hypothetical protein